MCFSSSPYHLNWAAKKLSRNSCFSMIPFMFVSKYLNHDLRIEVSWDIWDGIRKAMRSHPWKSAEAYRAYQRVYGRKNPFDGGGLSQATYTEMYGLYREQTQVIHYYMRYLNLKDLEPHSWLYRKTTTCVEVSVIVSVIAQMLWQILLSACRDRNLLVTSTSINIPQSISPSGNTRHVRFP